MEALPVSPQRFEAVSRRRTKIAKVMRRVKQVELPDHCRHNIRRNTSGTSRAPPVIEIRCGLVAE
jgi:hypothetical protein